MWFTTASGKIDVAVALPLLRQLASCLIYARALLEFVIFIMWLRSVIKMLPSMKFAEDKVLTSLFSITNAKIVQL